MVDPKVIDQLRNNEPLQYINGGKSRPSKYVDLQKFDTIQRRQNLNEALLKRACGEPVTTPTHFEKEDLGILLQIIREHDPNANPMIRKHAIDALGQYHDLEVVEVLSEILSSDMEDEQARAHSLASIAKITPKVAQNLTPQYTNDKSSVVGQAAIYTLGEIGDESTIGILTELLKKPLHDVSSRQHIAMAVQSIQMRHTISLTRDIKKRLKLPKGYKRSRTPKRET